MLAQQAGAVAFAPPREALTERDRAVVGRLRDEIRALRQERALLRARFLPPGRLPAVLGLSPQEAAAVSVLLVNAQVTHELMYQALFHDAADQDPPPAAKSIDVLIFKARNRLSRFGIAIETFQRRGWQIAPQGKARMLMLMRAEAEATGRPIGDYVRVDIATFPYQVARVRPGATSSVSMRCPD